MRIPLTALLGVICFAATGLAQAKVAITVDKDAQEMSVAVDGVTKYNWPVSTGNPSHETPNGSFRTFRMEADHFSKEFDDAPMPHSIFFTKVGHAIHGTESEGHLGTPVSHGCVRLSRANATTLYALVEKEGVLNTTVTLTGSSRVALARLSTGKRPTAVARRDVTPAYPTYDGTGAPIDVAPRQIAPAQRQVLPQQVARDDGYIYPADGSSVDQRYPAPRGYRRQYDPQSNSGYYSGQDNYDPQSYAPPGYAPQVYAPRRYY